MNTYFMEEDDDGSNDCIRRDKEAGNRSNSVVLADSGYVSDDALSLADSSFSPPPPYSSENSIDSCARSDNKTYEHILKCKPKHFTTENFHYSDVGEDIYITICKKPDEDLGITLICGEVFTPSWPAIIDIKKNSTASKTTLKIGDQIKELLGIDTGTITHWQLMTLFSKAVDEITMTVRRTLDRTETAFDWYKHPFSSVQKSFEELVITNEHRSSPTQHNEISCSCNGTVHLRTFRETDDGIKCCAHEHTRVPLSRTLSLNRETRHYNSNSLPTRRGTVANTAGNTVRKKQLTAKGDGKLIADEIKKIQLQKAQRAAMRHSLCGSLNSVSSTLSDSTVSSFSSTSSATFSDQGQGNWIDHLTRPSESYNYNQDVFETSLRKTSGIARTSSTKLPGARLRQSIRKKINKNFDRNKEEMKYALKCKDIAENTLLLTVWIIDRRKLGLQLGGGSVSAYGDSNVKIIDIKKCGSGYKIFKVGDELLEIGGVVTNGLSVYDVNCMISKLEGQYAEFKIFRPIGNN